nr:putative reverse transcriptase domain-containing protein [Tanacetum cinerariifolium]
MILAAQNETVEGVNAPAKMMRGLDEHIERKDDGVLYYMDRIWVCLTGDVKTLIMDEAHKSRYSIHPGVDKMYYDLRDMYRWPRMKKNIDLYVSKCLTCSKIVQETTEKISHIKDRIKAARDRQKSYADKCWKPLEFNVGDHVLLKVSSWKGVVRFGKKGKLAQRFIEPVEITERIEEIQVDATLNFVEEPVEILEREIKKLKRSRIPIAKVRWNSKRGP